MMIVSMSVVKEAAVELVKVLSTTVVAMAQSIGVLVEAVVDRTVIQLRHVTSIAAMFV